jgi:hypothetical protein
LVIVPPFLLNKLFELHTETLELQIAVVDADEILELIVSRNGEDMFEALIDKNLVGFVKLIGVSTVAIGL